MKIFMLPSTRVVADGWKKNPSHNCGSTWDSWRLSYECIAYQNVFVCTNLLEYIGFSVLRGTLKKNSQSCLPFCSWDLGCKLTSMVINIANPMIGQRFHFVGRFVSFNQFPIISVGKHILLSIFFPMVQGAWATIVMWLSGHLATCRSG